MIKFTNSNQKVVAKVFTDVPNEKALKQIERLTEQEFVFGNKIRVMPDYHWGAGCTIGLTMTLDSKKVAPNLVGVDIGCGMETVKFGGDLDFEKLDDLINISIPSGQKVRFKEHEFVDMARIGELKCFARMDAVYARKSIGSLGGGNHFIEINKGENSETYLVIHSGSRNLGKRVADFYQAMAVQYHDTSIVSQDVVSKTIQEMKKNGRQKEISSFLEDLRKKEMEENKSQIPDDLAYLEGDLFEAYIHDMKICQEYANLNRLAMAQVILDGMDWEIESRFSTVHNYIDTETMILRKGAVSAEYGETLLIPLNMRDGSIIAVGKGNEDWNFSAPHGAGRVLGRGQARRALASGEITMNQFEGEMDGIYTTSVSVDTIDESPMAYKTMDYLMRNIGETVEVLDVIKPLYNFKANK